MKKTLLILTLTLIISQQLQSQSLFDIGSAIISSSKSSKKQKKIERESFVKDSLIEASQLKDKRNVFVADSTKEADKKQEYIKYKVGDYNKKYNELFKRKSTWEYENGNTFSLNQQGINVFTTSCLKKSETFDIVKISECKDYGGYSSYDVVLRKDETNEHYKAYVEEFRLRVSLVDVYSDSTATNKISSIKFSELPIDDIYTKIGNRYIGDLNRELDMNMYGDCLLDKNYLLMLKSKKNNKIYVVGNYAFNFFDTKTQTNLFQIYIDPSIQKSENDAVFSFRNKVKSGVSIVKQMVAIQNKHLVNMVNYHGVVVEQKYDTTKFTKLELTTYKQLHKKLAILNDEIANIICGSDCGNTNKYSRNILTRETQGGLVYENIEADISNISYAVANYTI